ncbi:MAG: tetrahydrofolate dehydrogenase/cyclohydrolase catalytic domain-containing protein, partial [bacterium]|nr:tetrahydrofolate dehydrogenase/cyclohydrolase catalytic domain-containing protein [bacterium]
MQVIDGRALAREILNDTKHHIAKHGITPGLAILLVGQDPASHLYVQLKEKAASKIGVRFEKHLFPAATTQATIIQTIKTLNQRTDVHGIVVQLPLPKPLDENAVVEAIAPAKDVDGFHPENIRRLIEGKVVLVPALAQSIVALVRQPGIV